MYDVDENYIGKVSEKFSFRKLKLGIYDKADKLLFRIEGKRNERLRFHYHDGMGFLQKKIGLEDNLTEYEMNFPETQLPMDVKLLSLCSILYLDITSGETPKLFSPQRGTHRIA